MTFVKETEPSIERGQAQSIRVNEGKEINESEAGLFKYFPV